jgi:peroxiredoxin
LAAQNPAARAEAKALFEEIRKLPDLPDLTRDHAFREIVQKVRRQPQEYRLILLSNLVVSADEVATESATLRQIADLIVEELHDPPQAGSESAFGALAELAFYRHIEVSFDDPRYRAELAKLEAGAKTRAHADFTLLDTTGKSWHLKDLKGKVVLVNFWATWCAPCQRELPDFQSIHERFRDRGLLILAVTGEDAATVKQFLVDHPMGYRILLDPADATKKTFAIEGIPHSMLYDREGRMVGQIPSPFTKAQLLQTLSEAGLK